MQSTEEMLAAGIQREVKMMALDRQRRLTSELGLILVSDDEMVLAEACADLVVKLTQRLEELQAENDAAFPLFQAAAAEVDALEAMLQDGGEELTCCSGSDAEELAMDARAERDAWRREQQEG